MLKRFFINVLGTMTGIWLSIFLFFFIGIVVMAVAIANGAGSDTVDVKKHSILYFDLSGEVAERYQSKPFFQAIQQIDKNKLTLNDMLDALVIAADDDKIDGVYLHCSGAQMGMASREEFIEAIEDFKASSGKWVVAYADSYTQGDYIIASAADKVYLNPVGSVDIHGMGGIVPFYKGLLDKIGVRMQIIKVGTFKSAVEPYTLNAMSEPARLQMQQYCDTLWAYAAGTIAAGRNIPVTEIYALAPRLIGTRVGDVFVDNGLVDQLKYEREVNDYLHERTDIDKDKDLRLVSPAEYLAADGGIMPDNGGKHVAVYYAVGEISDSGSEGIVGATVTQDIIDLANDKDVRGLVMRVNSPGGSAFASEQIWEALQYFKSKGKPLYVSMGDYAASGGYYISCGADTIYADRTTITGSIGVFGMIPDISGLVTDKFGVNFSTVETNRNGAGISLVEPMTPDQYQAMQTSVENIYDLFTSRVADGRHMTQDAVKAIAEGRVWVGSRAIELGLVDYLGSLDDAICAITDDLGLDADQYVEYPRGNEKFWEKLLRESANLEEFDATLPYDVETLRTLMVIRRLRDAAPIQARMEDVVVR